MRKLYLVLMGMVLFSQFALAQDKGTDEQKGFRKDKLFTGGSISLSISSNYFLIGVNPEFGYSLTKWADLGIVANYNYSSYKDFIIFDDRLKQTIFGGGLFTRIFPIRFLYAQAQVEHNWIRLKYMPNNGDINEKRNLSGNSVLVGAGYATGRDPNSGSLYGYMSILFDVTKEANSPYTDGQGRAVPIVRAGVIVPLFQRSR